MKANEAPENNKRKAPNKIYACFGVFGLIQATEIRVTSRDVEYTRTDAFIEKACEYFHRSLEDTRVIDDYRNILVRGIQASYTSVEEFIEDFKNYMEGE